MTYNQEAGAHEGNFLVSNIIAGVNAEQKIGEIKFKIKQDAKQGTTQIKFRNVTSNDGQNLVKESDKTITIKIIGETNNTNIVTPINNTNNTPEVPNVTNTNTNTVKSNLPYTGANDFIKVALVLLSTVSIIAYIKYQKIK